MLQMLLESGELKICPGLGSVFIWLEKVEGKNTLEKFCGDNFWSWVFSLEDLNVWSHAIRKQREAESCRTLPE